MKLLLSLLGVLVACGSAFGFHRGYGGFGRGYGGYFGGYNEVIIEEPVIPVSGGLVDAYSYVDSYFPGGSVCGYGTYGPAYGGRGYPIEVYGGVGLYGRGGFGRGLYY